MDTTAADDFFEEDEPVDEVLAAYEAGPHTVTAPPISTLVLASSMNAAVGSPGYTHSPGVVMSDGKASVSVSR